MHKRRIESMQEQHSIRDIFHTQIIPLFLFSNNVPFILILLITIIIIMKRIPEAHLRRMGQSRGSSLFLARKSYKVPDGTNSITIANGLMQNPNNCTILGCFRPLLLELGNEMISIIIINVINGVFITSSPTLHV